MKTSDKQNSEETMPCLRLALRPPRRAQGTQRENPSIYSGKPSFAVLKSTDSESQAQGQREIAGLLTAVGVRGVDDEKDLIGMRLKLVKCGKRVKEFLPAPEALAA
jgi:hypothetical protein